METLNNFKLILGIGQFNFNEKNRIIEFDIFIELGHAKSNNKLNERL